MSLEGVTFRGSVRERLAEHGGVYRRWLRQHYAAGGFGYGGNLRLERIGLLGRVIGALACHERDGSGKRSRAIRWSAFPWAATPRWKKLKTVETVLRNVINRALRPLNCL